MNSTRHGKIARLPRHVRDQLNHRLDDGQEAIQLATWLNSLPEVQAVLAASFDGQPISEMNLSNWKQGGFLDWQNLQQKRDAVARLSDAAADLPDTAGPGALADSLSRLLATDFALAATALLDAAPEPQDRWQRLRQLLPELARLREADHRSQLLELARRQADQRSQFLELARRQTDHRSELLALARRRADRLEAEARDRDDALNRAQEHLLSGLYASPDPTHQAWAAALSDHIRARTGGLLASEHIPSPAATPPSPPDTRPSTPDTSPSTPVPAPFPPDMPPAAPQPAAEPPGSL